MPDRGAFRAILPTLALVLLTGVACFWRLGGCGILDLDEGLYSAAAREMTMTGDIIVPRVNGAPFFEKPPLAYWTAAAGIRLLGRTEAAARLPSALATAATAWLLALWGRKRLGARAGLLAGAFYLTSPLVLGPARMLTMDAALCLWIAVAMVAAYEAMDRARGAWLWAAVSGAACGLGVLAKGLPGVVFPVATAVLWCGLVERRLSAAVRRLRPMLGPAAVAAFLLVAVPWHVLAFRASGELFWGEYIVRQHLGRFRGGDTSHLAPFWFYAPVFLAGLFPWSVFAPSAYWRAVRDAAGAAERRLAVFLALWASLVFVAFSASGSKLVSYILPMAAPTALLVGWWWSRALDAPEAARRSAFVAALVAVCVSGALFGILALHGPILAAVERATHRPIALDANGLAMIAYGERLFLVAAVGCVVAAGLTWAGSLRGALISLLGAMLIFVAMAVDGGLSMLNDGFTAPLHRMVSLAAHEGARGGSLLLNVGAPRRPSALYYLPDQWLTDGARAAHRLTEDGSEEAAKKYFSEHPGGVAVMPRKRAAQFVAHGLAWPVAQSSDWAVVRGTGRATP